MATRSKVKAHNPDDMVYSTAEQRRSPDQESADSFSDPWLVAPDPWTASVALAAGNNKNQSRPEGEGLSGSWPTGSWASDPYGAGGMNDLDAFQRKGKKARETATVSCPTSATTVS